MTQTRREYTVQGSSTETFGRVLIDSGPHHFIVDGPAQNGCPGEAITPVEVFLSGIAACGVELVQVVAKDEEIPLESVRVSVRGDYDRENPVRDDYTVFDTFEVDFTLLGVTDGQAEALVEAFKGR